jgi:hypothetical protein
VISRRVCGSTTKAGVRELLREVFRAVAGFVLLRRVVRFGAVTVLPRHSLADSSRACGAA